MGGGLFSLQSLSDIKKSISPFYFQSNEPFSKFLRQRLRHEVPWYGKRKQKINNTLRQHRSLLRQRDCTAYDSRVSSFIFTEIFFLCKVNSIKSHWHQKQKQTLEKYEQGSAKQ